MEDKLWNHLTVELYDKKRLERMKPGELGATMCKIAFLAGVNAYAEEMGTIMTDKFNKNFTKKTGRKCDMAMTELTWQEIVKAGEKAMERAKDGYPPKDTS